MNITKKVKIMIIVVWLTALVSMVIGTCIIGKYFITGTYGSNHSLQLLYSQNDPVNDVYKAISAERESIINKVKSNPGYYLDKKNAADLNERTSANNTYVIMKVDDEYTFVGVDTFSDALKNQLKFNDSSTNISTIDEDTDVGGENQIKVQEYLMTQPSMYLCNQISYVYQGQSVDLYMLTYYGNYMDRFRGTMFGYIILMVVIMFILSGLVALLIYQQFVNPLVKLKQAAEKMGSGNLDEKIEICKNREDEVGELCESFENMRQRMSDFAKAKMHYEEENRQLISNISHDLRTPITTIKGYVEGIMDGVADTPEKRDRYLKMIYSKANEMDSLINELSLYTNINNNAIPYEFHRVSVKDYFNDCMEEVHATLMSKNMTLTYRNYCDDDVMVIVDPDQLKRVINNIVTNSIKYMDKEYGQVDISIYDNDAEVKIAINDNGRGIDTDSLPHIFDRMYRADSARQSRGGSGLGLAICKKIVEEHGGNIYATSQIGKGTTIVFTLKKYIPKDVGNGAQADGDEESAENSQKDIQKKDGQRRDNQKKDTQRKSILQIINPLKKRRDTDEQNIDN